MWKHRVTLKHLLTEKEDHESIQRSMNALADVLDKDPWFYAFAAKARFRKIPRGDDIIAPVDYANKLMARMYDYADEKRIWIG
jgi:hypothetical protein